MEHQCKRRGHFGRASPATIDCEGVFHEAGLAAAIPDELVGIKRIERHPENGRPSYEVGLTDRGFRTLRRIRGEN